MVHELTTRRVLTMEWVEGVRLRSAGEDPSAGRALNPEDMRLVGVRLQYFTLQAIEAIMMSSACSSMREFFAQGYHACNVEMSSSVI